MNCNIDKLHISLNLLNLNLLDNLNKLATDLFKNSEEHLKSELKNHVFLDKFDHFDNN